MQQQIDQLKITVTKLRADLMASNLAIGAMASVLSTDQQRQTLKALAELSAMQEQTAEQAGMPEAVGAMRQATQGMWTALEGVMKMRQAKTGGA